MNRNNVFNDPNYGDVPAVRLGIVQGAAPPAGSRPRVYELWAAGLTNPETPGAPVEWPDPSNADDPPNRFRAVLLGTLPPKLGIALSAGNRLILIGRSNQYITVTGIFTIDWPWAGVPLLSLGTPAGILTSNQAGTLAQPLDDGTDQRTIKIDEYTYRLTVQWKIPGPGELWYSYPLDNLYVAYDARCHKPNHQARYDFTVDNEDIGMRNGTLDLGLNHLAGSVAEPRCNASIPVDTATTRVSYLASNQTAIFQNYGWHVACEIGTVDLPRNAGYGDPAGSSPGLYGVMALAEINGEHWQFQIGISYSINEFNAPTKLVYINIIGARLVYDNIYIGYYPVGNPPTGNYWHPQNYGPVGSTPGNQWLRDCAGTAVIDMADDANNFLLERPAQWNALIPLFAYTNMNRDVDGVLTPGPFAGQIPCANPLPVVITQTWRGWPEQREAPIPAEILHYPPNPPEPPSHMYTSK